MDKMFYREHYKNEFKPYLKMPDGKVHVILYRSIQKKIKTSEKVDQYNTEMLDGLISCMQDDRYEIVDIKFSETQTLYPNVLILYK